jgi:hypothetical protein
MHADSSSFDDQNSDQLPNFPKQETLSCFSAVGTKRGNQAETRIHVASQLADRVEPKASNRNVMYVQ